MKKQVNTIRRKQSLMLCLSQFRPNDKHLQMPRLLQIPAIAPELAEQYRTLPACLSLSSCSLQDV